MIKKVKNLFQTNFYSSVFVLISGTLLSQALIIVTTPILTRLYSPKDFGILALFTSLSSIAAIISTGRYELSIGLPKKNSEARILTNLVLVIGFFVSLFYLGIIVILRYYSQYFNNFKNLLDSPYVFMVPIFTFFAATISSLQYFSQRKKRYKLITVLSFIQTGSTIVFSVFFAKFYFVNGALVYSVVIGQTFAIIYCLLKINDFKINFNYLELKRNAKLHINFPKFMLISDLAFTVNQQIIPILFSILFNSTIVGFYSLANRILKIPTIVLGSSISNVFRNEVIDYVQMNKCPKPLFISTLKKLLIVSVPTFILLGILSPQIFVFVFGQKWNLAGNFAQLLSVMIFFDFISSPFISLFYILKKQKAYMIIQVSRTFFNVLSIIFGKYFLNEAYSSLICYIFSDVIFSCCLLIYINRLLSHHDNKK